MIVTIWRIRDDSALAERTSVWFAVISLIQAQAFRAAAAFANPNAIYRLQQFALVVPVGFTQGEVQRMTVGLDHHVAFEATNTVFS